VYWRFILMQTNVEGRPEWKRGADISSGYTEGVQMMDSLQIRVDSNKETAMIHLRGRVSIETSSDLRRQLLTTLLGQNPPIAIALDLAEVSYMDTSGLATLIEGLKIARIGGRTMRLQGLDGRLLHLFQVTGIGSLFETAGPADNPSRPMVS